MVVSQYAGLCLAESREHLSGCNQLLLAWEREPANRDAVSGLFRSIHTIKGMAATMGFAGVADLAHRMESLLDALRQGQVSAVPENLPPVMAQLQAAPDQVELDAAVGHVPHQGP